MKTIQGMKLFTEIRYLGVTANSTFRIIKYQHLTLGFPQWQVAMMHRDGIIKGFPIDGLAYSSFPKLPKKGFGFVPSPG